MEGTTAAFTGHRPDKLGGYNEQTFIRLVRLAKAVLTQGKPADVISGMAQGWDMAVAFAAIQLGIPVTAAIPFEGQHLMWPEHAQGQWHAIKAKCTNVQLISRGGFAGWKMQKRNEWMVDHGHHLVALWDGSTGGTANCMKYTNTLRPEIRPVITNVWPMWVKEFKDQP